MMRHAWTPELEGRLCELYPVETNERVAYQLDMGLSSVKKKARELGLVKYRKSDWLDRAETVRSYFRTHSYSEIARMARCSRSQVQRIAKALGLRKSDRDRRQTMSRIRTEAVLRERCRMRLGFEPISSLKVVTNRARIKLRCTLKALGYIVGHNARVLFYTPSLERDSKRETRGLRLGLRFEPWPDEEPLAQAI